MPDVASLGIEVDSRNVKQASNDLGNFADQGEKAARSADKLGSETKKTEQETGKLSRSVAGMIAKYVGIGAAVAGITKLARASLDAAAAIEVQETNFGVLMGDMREGEQLFQQLQDFSAATPLAIENLSGAAQQLMSFGIEADNVTDTLQMLGDASLGNAQKLDTLSRAYGRVQARGRASMEEINMAMEAGLPIIAELADEMGVSEQAVFDMVSAGKVGADEFNAAFESMTGEGGQFNNGMEILSETFNGKLSTAMDNVKILGATMFEPAIERGKVFLDTLTDISKELTDEIGGMNLARQLDRGDIELSDLSSMDQLRAMRANARSAVGEQGQRANRGLSNTLDQELVQLGRINDAMAELEEGSLSAGDIIQNAIAEQLERAEESAGGLSDRMRDIISDRTDVYDAFNNQLATIGILDEAGALSPEERINRLISANERYAESLAALGQDSLNAQNGLGMAELDQALERIQQLQRVLDTMNGEASGPYGPNVQASLLPGGRSQVEEDTTAWQQFAEAMGWAADEGERLRDASVEIASAFQEAMVSGVADQFVALGEAFASGADLGDALQDSLEATFRTLLNQLPVMFTAAALQAIIAGQWWLAAGLLGGAMATGVGAGIANAAENPEGRAQGGSVHGNTPYIVGENGPELHIPGSSGRIIPNSQLGGGQTNVIVNNYSGAQVQTRERDNNGVREVELIVGRVVEKQVSEGRLDRTMSQRYGMKPRGR